jgi:hypothetical protein
MTRLHVFAMWPWHRFRLVRFIFSPYLRSARLLICVVIFGVGVRYIVHPAPRLTLAPASAWVVAFTVLALATGTTTFYRRWEWPGRLAATLLAATLGASALENWDIAPGNSWVLVCMAAWILLEAAGDAYSIHIP